MVMAVTTVIGVAGLAVGAAGLYLGQKNADRASAMAGNQQAMEGVEFGEQQDYVSKLNDLMANPASVSKLPGYQFQLDQGEDAIARTMAGSGFRGSGNEAAALTTFAQGTASSAYQQQEQMLAGLSGLAPTSAGQFGSNANGANGNSISASGQQFNQLGGLLASVGYMNGNSINQNQNWAGTSVAPVPDLTPGGGYTYSTGGKQ